MKYSNNNNEWIGNSNKAIAILRVSTKKQVEGLSHTIQAERVAEWIKEKGLDLIEVFKIYESAKDSDSRKKYHHAISWALKNGARHILFYMGDREARNLTDNEYNEKLVLQDRIVLHYVQERKILHKDSPESDFTARDYQAVGSKDFSRRLRVKVVDAMRRKAEEGWFPNNHAPLGYIHSFPIDENGRAKKRGSTIVKNPNKNAVKQVQREFELCAQGYSVASIRELIIEAGFVPPSKVKTYSKHGIEARLKNKFYRGSFDWQGIEYKGKHELIIPKPILDAVDERFGHKRVHRRASVEKGIFSGGWIRCGHPECGLQIVCEHTKKKIKETGEKKEFKYYRCSNSRGVHESLKGMYTTEEDLMKAFEPALDRISITAQRAQEIADALNETDRIAKEAIAAEMNGYRKALEDLHKRRLSYLICWLIE
ncbi:MAG: recombinase family protein [Bdellovibrionales bacterium]|nr:recombinase family protein [Bdellovibrionales bacterium]